MDAINTANPPAITPAPLVPVGEVEQQQFFADVNVDHIISGPRIREAKGAVFATHWMEDKARCQPAFNALQKATILSGASKQLPLPPKKLEELMKHPKKAGIPSCGEERMGSWLDPKDLYVSKLLPILSSPQLGIRLSSDASLVSFPVFRW